MGPQAAKSGERMSARPAASVRGSAMAGAGRGRGALAGRLAYLGGIVGILVASVLLFIYRRVVQDKESVHWREETPTMPEGADREALIQAGWSPTEAPAGTVPAAG